MKAKINGFEIEGTPEEIKQLIGVSKEVEYVPVYPTYPTYPAPTPIWPNTSTPYPPTPWMTWIVC